MATLDGRPVYFRRIDAKATASNGLMARAPDFQIGEALSLILTFGAALVLAALNLKAGRADTKGGFRLAVRRLEEGSRGSGLHLSSS